MKRMRDGPRVTDGLILGHEDVGVVALLAQRGELLHPPLDCQPAKLLDHVQDAMDHMIPWSPVFRWQWLHRLVSLSGLGWAFVLAAVLWELFALAFSKCAGWGWDKGAFFFAWGLGILALGFCLRTSAKRPAFSRFFLGVNVIVLTVLSLVVATR